MKYLVIDARYHQDKGLPACFGTNDLEEAITVADEFGEGSVVICADKTLRDEVVYISAYRAELAIIK